MHGAKRWFSTKWCQNGSRIHGTRRLSHRKTFKKVVVTQHVQKHSLSFMRPPSQLQNVRVWTSDGRRTSKTLAFRPPTAVAPPKRSRLDLRRPSEPQLARVWTSSAWTNTKSLAVPAPAVEVQLPAMRVRLPSIAAQLPAIARQHPRMRDRLPFICRQLPRTPVTRPSSSPSPLARRRDRGETAC